MLLLQEVARAAGQMAADSVAMPSSPAFEATERAFGLIARWLRLSVEAIGALVIAAGVVVGVVQFLKASFARQPDGYNDVRLQLARFLAVALEFQLGADLLSTAIAPSWTTIRNLAAIAIIRTGLNYFLGKEMREEASRLTAAGASPREAAKRATGATVPGEGRSGPLAARADGG